MVTVSLPRRALSQLFGIRQPDHLEPPAREGYSLSRRVLAGLLGVQLPDRSRVPPVGTTPGVTRSASTASNEYDHDDHGGRGETKVGEFARPPQFADGSAEPHRDYTRVAEQVLARSQSDLLAAVREVVAEESPARLALRGDPVILAVVTSDLITRAIAIAMVGQASDGSHARDVWTRAIAELALDRARARRLARRLALDRELERDLALDRALALARAHPLDLARAVVLNRALGRALDLDLDLALEGGREHDLARELDRILTFVLNLGLDLDLASELSGVLDLARDLTKALAGFTARRYTLRNAEGLAAALLEDALDDFTQADLSVIDLANVNLTGILWSDRYTRWPPGTDMEQLRSVSRETEPDSGVYVILVSGGTGRTAAAVLS
jgi:hypothetical protein